MDAAGAVRVMLSHFLIWSLAVCGCTLILTRSTLFEYFRGESTGAAAAKSPATSSDPGTNSVQKFFGCPLCIGFWVGFWATLLWWSPAHEMGYPALGAELLANGCLGSLLSSVVVRAWNLLGVTANAIQTWAYLRSQPPERNELREALSSAAIELLPLAIDAVRKGRDRVAEDAKAPGAPCTQAPT